MSIQYWKRYWLYSLCCKLLGKDRGHVKGYIINSSKAYPSGMTGKSRLVWDWHANARLEKADQSGVGTVESQ